MISFCNRINFEKDKQEISSYLDVNLTPYLLNPTMLDTITGFIIKDSQGEGAKKKLPQRHLNMVDEAIFSHCCILNSAERLELIRKSNEVAAIMGELEVDRLRIREENKRKKEAEIVERAARKAAKENQRREKEKK